jgi:multisubunit Na+/H+ antiporter MnhF subunit
MNYGAKEANSKEAMGLAIFVVGLVLLAAGWAYGIGIFQSILMLLGLVGFVGGFVVLRAAKAGA